MNNQKQAIDHYVVAYLTLEDFIQDVLADDALVRVEGITKTLNSKAIPGGLLQYLIIITARTGDTIAMTSIKVGETWSVFAKDEPYHDDNLDQATHLVKQRLASWGFCVAPGIWNPHVVMDNLVRGHADLWHFEDKRLVPNEQGQDT